jgi:hypothetical protein
LSEVIPANRKIKKRTFLGLLLAALLFLLFMAFYLLLVASDRYAAFSRSVVMGLTISTLIFTLLFLFGLLAIVLTIMQKRTFPSMRWFIEKTLLLLYPFVLQIGRFMHIAQEKIQRSFIEVNNQLVRARAMEIKANELLLLLPHCLQNDKCSYKITRNVNNCRRCGKCQLAEILRMSSARGFRVEVVTGGTLARRAIEEYGPRTVIAVACERDLSSGVLDSFPLPVIGVINERPQGPCFNTRVDLTALQESLDFLLGKK